MENKASNNNQMRNPNISQSQTHSIVLILIAYNLEESFTLGELGISFNE